MSRQLRAFFFSFLEGLRSILSMYMAVHNICKSSLRKSMPSFGLLEQQACIGYGDIFASQTHNFFLVKKIVILLLRVQQTLQGVSFFVFVFFFVDNSKTFQALKCESNRTIGDLEHAVRCAQLLSVFLQHCSGLF